MNRCSNKLWPEVDIIALLAEALSGWIRNYGMIPTKFGCNRYESTEWQRELEKMLKQSEEALNAEKVYAKKGGHRLCSRCGNSMSYNVDKGRAISERKVIEARAPFGKRYSLQTPTNERGSLGRMAEGGWF